MSSDPFEPMSKPASEPIAGSGADSATVPTNPIEPPFDEYSAAPETVFPVEQLSLAELLGTLIRRPGLTIGSLQDAFVRSGMERRLARESRLAANWAEQPYPVEDDDPIQRTEVAPRRSTTSGVLSNLSRTVSRRSEALTPAAVPNKAEVGNTDLVALLNGTSVAVLTVPQIVLPGTRNEAQTNIAVGTRSPAIALIGMVIGWLIVAFGVIYAMSSGQNYDQVIQDIFPIATILVAVGIGIFATFGVRLMPHTRSIPIADSLPTSVAAQRRISVDWLNAHIGSVIVGGLALIFAGGAWLFNADNTFTPVGVICWLLSVFLWWSAFDPALLRFRWLRRGVAWVVTLPSHLILIRTSWSAVALIAILIIGGYTRLHALSAYPPDMTSDAVEMILDTQRVADGARPVFLPTNGGRESAEPYLYVGILHNILGVPIDYDGLKLLNGIEGIFTLLAVYWLARALLDDQDKPFANLVGLIAAGLVAVSYWDIVLSRMAERIVLAPIAVCLICVYFIRAVRYNRLQDYVRCGLGFGVGLYAYQSIRILPVMFVVCMVITLIMRVRSWQTLRRYFLYSAAFVIMALAVFMPLARFAIQYPDYFWSRTYGRLFGQDNGTLTVTDPKTGQSITRAATFQNQISALEANAGYLGSNLVKSALMFTWAGDRSWFTGTANGLPEMDELTGALFLIGVGLWIVRLAVRRDPGDWVVPLAIFAGLLATALALAFTIEVPSATRGSNALPFAYILAAFAGALMVRQIRRVLPDWRGTLLTGLAVVLAIVQIGTTNVDRYVNVAMVSYRANALPHAQAGQILKDFGALYGIGNAFIISYPYWWDHRAVAIEADDLGWAANNGIDNGNTDGQLYQQSVTTAIRNNFGTRYEIKANHPLMFFINQKDQAVQNSLLAWLPAGSTVEHVAAFTPDADFVLVLSAPVDCTWLNTHIAPNNVSQDCTPTAGTSPTGSSVESTNG